MAANFGNNNTSPGQPFCWLVCCTPDYSGSNAKYILSTNVSISPNSLNLLIASGTNNLVAQINTQTLVTTVLPMNSGVNWLGYMRSVNSATEVECGMVHINNG